jgi:hypothetical protein
LTVNSSGPSRDQFDAKLELFKVWFGLSSSDPKVVDPYTHKRAVAINGNIDTGRQGYLNEAASMRVFYETNGLLTPELKITFDTLIKKITYW